MDDIQLEWEHAPCAFCGSERSELLFQGPDRLEGLSGIFQMSRCCDCGLFRQNPRLKWASLKTYYPENYVSYQYAKSERIAGWKEWIKQYGNKKKRKAVESYQPGGRLLEIGCGTGGFLEELKSSGKWELEGIEPNEAAAAYARQKLQIPIFQGRFVEIEGIPNSFDAIIMWYVVEHMAEPIEEFRHAFRLLKKGGWLFFSVPNLESLDVRVFRQYWSGWDLPRHLYIFPRSILHQVINDIGFKVFSERCIASEYFLLGHSLDFWSQSWEKRSPLLKKILIRIYYSWITRLLLVIPLKVLDNFRLSTTISIFAQKE